MDFEFTEDQAALRDTVAKWTQRDFDFSRRHKLALAGGKTSDVYNELAALGLTALAVPEEFGGLGMTYVDAMAVMEELGRALVNAPYTEGALVTPSLFVGANQDIASQWLPKIAEGTYVAPALQERRSRYNVAHVSTNAVASGEGYVLQGQKSVVCAADEAEAFIVSARLSGDINSTDGIGLFLVEANADALEIKAYPTQDGGRAGELVLNDVPATLINSDSWEALQKANDVGIAASCAEGVGLMDVFADMTAEYMKTRKQFGVPLSSFQALTHRLADVTMYKELGRSMSYYGSLNLEQPTAIRRRALSQAKVQLGKSMRFVGESCVQLHGGIAVTDEYIGSHYFKRLTMLEMAYGDTEYHLGEVSDRMLMTAGI